MKILVADDDFSIRKAIEYDFKEKNIEAIFAEDGKEAIELFDKYTPDIVILDIKMPKKDGMAVLDYILKKSPDTKVIMISAHGTVEIAVDAMKKGAYDFIVKPFSLKELSEKIESIKEELEGRKNIEFFGKSSEFIKLKNTLLKLAKVDSTVLITGESGTGKEMAARFIHYNSDRKDKKMVAVNCAVLSKELLASELFGHKKGAFTGASEDKIGKFEQADGGTIFLDEIGELTPELQAKLLRVLQENEIEVLGGDVKRIDVRVIAATNRDLEKMIEEGKFRRDLYYRINVINVNMPPLREREEDIIELSYYFAEKISKKAKKDFKGITKEAEKILLNYDFPGNIRELKNIIERAVVLGDTNYITEKDLEYLKIYEKEEKLQNKIIENEKETIIKYMAKAKNKTELAKMLGIKRTTLLYKLKKYDLDF
jgi:DNA-binding NtrC family response regulator